MNDRPEQTKRDATADRLRRRMEALEQRKGAVDQRRDQLDQLIVLLEQRLEEMGKDPEQ